MEFDSLSLDAELRAAGLSISGCASTGRIDWLEPPTPAQLTMAQAVLDAHNPSARQAAIDAEDAAGRAALSRLRTTPSPTPVDLRDAILWLSHGR